MATITLRIPEATEWPVEGRDPVTGDLRLQRGFQETVADASGLALTNDGSGRPMLTEAMVVALLVEWYKTRLVEGESACPTMDALIAEARREALH